MRKKIFLLGSSMTERSFSLEFHGWGASMAHWYARSADVFNRGAGGYNSRWLNSYLPRLLADDKPDLAVVFIGNNDAIDECEAQHVPLIEFKSNIISILEQLYEVRPSMVVLLVTTTRVNEGLKPLQRDARRAKYAEVLRFIHRNRMHPEVLGTDRIPQDIGLIDLWGGVGVNDAQLAQQLSRYSVVASDLHDGSHLDAVGNKKVFSAIKDVINAQFPHLSPDFIRPRPVRAKRTSSGDFGVEYSSGGVSSSNAGGVASKKQMLASVSALQYGGENASSTSIISGNSTGVTNTTSTNSSTNNTSNTKPNTTATTSNSSTSLTNKSTSSTSTSTANSATAKVPALPAPVLGASGEPALQWTVPRWRHLV